MKTPSVLIYHLRLDIVAQSYVAGKILNFLGIAVALLLPGKVRLAMLIYTLKLISFPETKRSILNAETKLKDFPLSRRQLSR
jgi:hypothetical protein